VKLGVVEKAPHDFEGGFNGSQRLLEILPVANMCNHPQ
jgi:hypothetical protein